jgi:hypothetical protein
MEKYDVSRRKAPDRRPMAASPSSVPSALSSHSNTNKTIKYGRRNFSQ